ncbi:MAG: hypothetical protein P8Z39_02925 [Gammaproteobacteria bacterium]
MAGVIRDNPFLLPKRLRSARSGDDFSIKNLREWVDALPIGDTNRISNELYVKLEWLNQADIPPVDRFEILGLLQTPLNFVLDTLKRSCVENVFPLHAQSRVDADLRLDILIQAAIGYKIVLAQFHDDSITGFLLHKHIRAGALHSALYYLGEILLHSYIVYQPCLDYVWKELHGIYYYSISNELHMEKPVVLNGEDEQKLDITELYKQILLLALANPYSLLRGEADRVRDALTRWVTAAELASIKEPVWAKSFFLLDAQLDAKPCAPNICQRENIDIGWALITDNLVSLLEREIKLAKTAHMRGRKLRPADAVSERLLTKLKSAWTQEIRSRGVRSNSADMVQVVNGLEPLYRMHGGEVLVRGGNRPSDDRQLATDAGYARIDSVLLDKDEILVEDSLGTLQDRKMDRLEMPLMEIGHKECISINKSDNGCYLSWPEDGEIGTHVGDIVGVTPLGGGGAGKDVNLGVIRWMRVEQPGFLGMGVELLNGMVEPIILQRRSKDSKQVESLKGLLCHESDNSVSLIAPPFYVDADDHFRVITSEERRPIELSRIVESTDSFVRFQFE